MNPATNNDPLRHPGTKKRGGAVDEVVLKAYCENMKNITVSVDDETYRQARMRAAERETSISALVREFLDRLGSGESDFERLKREELALRERIRNFSAGDRLPRDDVHGRKR